MANVELQQIGPYSISRLLSASSTASFYVAKLPPRKKDVLIQVLHTPLATPETKEAFLARFKQLKRLRHRNLVEVQAADIIQDAIGNDCGYLVVEYIDGETLRQHIAPGTTMAPDEVKKRFLTPIADALHHAHTYGVVHGNLHPGNVLKSVNNELYITNFSLALPALVTPDEEAILLPYMAPELLQGPTNLADPTNLTNPATAASDQYSLAVMVYEWLCGQRPYAAISREELLHQQAHEPIAMPRSLNAAISPAVERILLQALAPAPGERFQNVYSFSNMYLRALMGLPIDEEARRPTAPLPTKPVVFPSPTADENNLTKKDSTALVTGTQLVGNEPVDMQLISSSLPSSADEIGRKDGAHKDQNKENGENAEKAIHNETISSTLSTYAGRNMKQTVGRATQFFHGRLIKDTLLGHRYTIIEQLDNKNSNAVYKATDMKLDTPLESGLVGIKEMNLTYLEHLPSDEASNTFRQASRTLAGLQHKGLPRIYDYFDEGGYWYLVMQFIKGQTLETYLNGQSIKHLPIEEALHIGLQVSNILDYLHKSWPPFIFRDLKPSNILLTNHGRIYLIGIDPTRFLKTEIAKNMSLRDIIGYTAPEQFGKPKSSNKSDIYTLGTILHQLLTGNDPAKTPAHLVPFQLGDDALLLRLESLIASMLSTNPKERPDGMEAVKEEIQIISDLHLDSRTNMTQFSLPQESPKSGISGENPILITPLLTGTQLYRRVKTDLSNDGILARSLQGYEERPAQVEMATLVAHSLTDDTHAITEASTGTGKSLAYLIPIVRSGKVAIISTANKALQEQLFYKDIPFVQQHIKPFRAALVKGMGNYICLDKFESERTGLQFYTKNPDFMHLVDIINNHELAFNGDFETLDFPLLGDIRSKIYADTDQCAWTKCQFFEECYIRNMRENAESAQVIVVNHTLLLIDAAIGGFLLPKRDIIVIDEAHHLEEEASRSFTVVVSPARINSLLIQNKLKQYTSTKTQYEASKAMNETWDRLQFMFDPRKGRVNLEESIEEGLRLSTVISDLAAELRSQRPLDLDEKDKSLYDKLLKRTQNLASDIRTVFSVDELNKFVYYVERENMPSQRGNSQLRVSAAPLDVTTWLRERLFDKYPVICTSATLATVGPNAVRPEEKGPNFAYFRTRVGLDPLNYPEVLESILPLTFDYESNALLYVPRHLPEPAYGDGRAAENYALEIAREMYRLVKCSHGRAFLLFSSKRMLDKAYDLMAPHLEFPLLRQGDMSRIELTRRFREEEGAVLFGLKSFWEGVDIAGDALSLVVIDKLPFEPPDDPVHEARVAQMKAAGENWFGTYVLPQAVLRLKQGLGRLLRTREDRGVMAILDTRLHTKGYGKQVLNALPPAQRTSSIKDVEQFFTV